MFEFFLVIASANPQFFSSLPPVLPRNQSFIEKEIMVQASQKAPFSLVINLLEVYEDRTPPPGASANHPVGHAVVRFRIENLTQNDIVASITKVEIRESSNDKVLISEIVNPFNLGGLQILEQGFHLTNPKGFMDLKEVKAVATYDFNGKTYTLESPKVKVVKHS